MSDLDDASADASRGVRDDKTEVKATRFQKILDKLETDWQKAWCFEQ